MRFLVEGDTLLNTMRQRRDTMVEALAVAAVFHANRCVNITMTDEQTGEVYRWPEVSKPSFHLK